jgi:hypothetical protein
MDSLTLLLTEQGLIEYEKELRTRGVTEPQHLQRLTPAVIETLIPDKPIHQRKLAALSREAGNMPVLQPGLQEPNAKFGDYINGSVTRLLKVQGCEGSAKETDEHEDDGRNDPEVASTYFDDDKAATEDFRRELEKLQIATIYSLVEEVQILDGKVNMLFLTNNQATDFNFSDIDKVACCPKYTNVHQQL